MDLITSLKPIDVYKHFKRFYSLREEQLNLLAKQEMRHPMDVRLNEAISGSLYFPDAYILKQILTKYRPKTILEIGSFLGFSTRWLLETSTDWNAQLSAVDPNIRHRIFDNPRLFVEKFNSKFYPGNLEIITGFLGKYDVKQIYHDYETYEPKKDKDYVDRLLSDRIIIDKKWNRRFDFIFIDGHHSYESTMNNFEIAYSLLNKGGCITFHDTLSHNTVYKAVLDLKSQYKNIAEVKICGLLDRKILRLMGRPIDGIGFFRLLS